MNLWVQHGSDEPIQEYIDEQMQKHNYYTLLHQFIHIVLILSLNTIIENN